MNARKTKVIVWAKNTSPRLDYVCRWLFGERLCIDFQITTDRPKPAPEALILGYGFREADIFIPDAGLLWESGFRTFVPAKGTRNALPTLFDTGGDEGFDLFSALFYLLSRYEEYGAYNPDKHGRFPPQASILHQLNCLQIPLADEWVHHFAQQLFALGLQDKRPPFAVSFTYDIDMAWQWKHRDLLRGFGGLIKNLPRPKALLQQIFVLLNKQIDPYDSFELIERLHQDLHLPARFFILSARKIGPFDKNTSLRKPAMSELIRRLSQFGTIGLHPSYNSSRNLRIIDEERKDLEDVVGKRINTTRAHFIRFVMPDTLRALAERGFTEDWSMGYGSTPGFRAGTSHSFFWYDLQQEKQTALRIFPFCFMDTTAHFEQALSPQEAFSRLRTMTENLRRINGSLCCIFHNFSLGTDPQWKNTRELYEQFLRDHAGNA